MEIDVNDSDAKINIVTPKGEIDMASSGELRNALHKIIKNKTPHVVVSLEEVSYIDSSGLATLIECMKKMQKYKGQLKLVITSSKILNVFKLARLDMIFQIHENITSATAVF